MEAERQRLLDQIRQWHFAAVELNLFLDTHPDEPQALDDYNEAVEQLMRLHREYERRYGPLTNHGGSPSRYPWQWIEEPWPWESGQ
ncbi:MAG: spore coat protein CotJB [Clostridia bacterium]|nr:spore coat protein CotJB [Clostridia bacterium]